MDSAAFATSMVGRAYNLASFNCWHLVAEAIRALHGVEPPRFRMRDARSREARLRAMESFSGWDRWREIDEPADRAVMLMRRNGCVPDVHAGIFLAPSPFEVGVLHADDQVGSVVFDHPLTLSVKGLDQIRYFLPAP